MVLALVMATPAVRAESARSAQRLEEGIRLYEDQEYRRAIPTLGEVERDPSATVKERARAFEYEGLSWLILDQEQLAREAFEALFKLDPRHELSDPSQSPKLREFYEEVRRNAVAAEPEKPAPEVKPTAPIAAPLPARSPQARRPIYKRWWLWTLVGVVVVGATVGTALALTLPRSAPEGTLPPGKVNLGLSF